MSTSPVPSNLPTQHFEQPTTTRKRSREEAQKASRPTRDDILANLAKDQNIVALLQAVVEYVYQIKLPNQLQRSTQSPLPSQPLDDASNRPLKRRRLTKPPAGAEEWIIPFPFQQEDDPQEWQADWETKRLTILLRSLLRSLRDWKGQRGTMAANPPHLTQSAIQIPETSRAGLGDLNDDDPLSLLLSMPDLADLRYEFLLQPMTNEGFFDFSTAHDNANLKVELQDLSGSHTPCQIPSESAVPDLDWDNFLQQSMIESQPDSTQVMTPEQSQTILDVEMAGTSLSTNDFPLDPANIPVDQNLNTLFPGLVQDKTPQPDLCNPSELPNNEPPILSDMDIQALLDFASLNPSDSSIPALTDTTSTAAASIPTSVETATPVNNTMELGMKSELELDSKLMSMQLDTPRSYAGLQLQLQTPPLLQTEMPQPSQAGPSISTLSRRGKARSSVALKKDLNKQLRQNAVDSEARSSPKKGVERIKKVRVNEATLKEREDTLEKAKEWRDVLAKQLEKARVARWEVMMEGVVLREMDLLLQTESSDTRME